MRLISNSEVGSWLQCRRKYYWEYVLDLEPKVSSEAISKGTLIHAMLEQYYVGKSMNLDESGCREMALEPLVEAANTSNADIVSLGKTRDLVTAYFDRWLENDERYEVHGVETKLATPITDDYSIAGTIDLILRDREDGRFVLVDHKSSYNFWTEDQANMSGQFVKYVFLGMNANLDVKAVMINQLRTRELKPGNDLFKRIFITPNESKVRAVMSQHITVSNEIIKFREQPDKSFTPPIFDKYICSNCAFLPLCDSDSSGAPIEYLIEAEYMKRTGYGYNHRETPNG